MRSNILQTLDPDRLGGDAQQFENELRNKVIGQDAAIEKVAEVYQMFLARLNPPNRPLGNLLFLGPTGSGETRVVEAVAETLFGDPRACLKIDCAEFQHSHEIAKLIGSPPGYLGHRETHPALTQEALNQWHTPKHKLSLLLFDEIEKASDALWQLLLGILDKATLTLGDNRRADFSKCLIFMTSNLGAAEMNNIASGGLGFRQRSLDIDASFDEKVSRAAQEAARRKFSPELTKWSSSKHCGRNTCNAFWISNSAWFSSAYCKQPVVHSLHLLVRLRRRYSFCTKAQIRSTVRAI